ncbi:hypothetical protein H6P81_017099 [Aristolochia fimbriata]|uniref:KIB1-4 beta-propeller domain-containing protein n=1 Tax=Aristolochia fimbriata TaxID=158543 RepID=A0AAV7DX52_ARIFI|nr:hypothetical protein H6P81_017099 [Aristolochia fimbriata]
MCGIPWIVSHQETSILLICCVPNSCTGRLEKLMEAMEQVDTGPERHISVGSSHGWLILNPLNHGHESMINIHGDCKVISSSSSSSGGTEVIAVSLLGLPGSGIGNLKFIRLGDHDEYWTAINFDLEAEDIIFYKNQLYAITSGGNLVVFDLGSRREQPRAETLATTLLVPTNPLEWEKHLAEMNGDLLLYSLRTMQTYS